ncbi:MAG: ATP-binding protein [Pseudomonadota bacterium]
MNDAVANDVQVSSEPSLWLLFGVVIITSPTLLMLFSVLDDPLSPAQQYAAPLIEYQFAGYDRLPTDGWKDIAAYDFAEAPTDGTSSVWIVREVDVQVLGSSAQSGIFIPYLYSNFAVYVNGALLLQTAPHTKPYYVNRAPRIIPVATEQLRAAAGRVVINGVTKNPNHYPFNMWVGPYDEIVASYDSHYVHHGLAPLIAVVVTLILAVAMLLLYAFDRRRSDYGWYALTVTLFAAHSGWFLVSHTPIDATAWSLAGRLTLFMALTTVIFYHRFFGYQYRKREWFLFLALFVSGALMVYTAFYDFSRYQIWMDRFTIVAGLVMIYANYFIYAMLARRRSFEALVLAIVAANGIVVAYRDMFFQLGLVESGSQFYIQYSSAFAALVFGYLLIRRFNASARQVEALNTHLEERIEAKSEELKETYAALNQEQSRRVLADERARIMRDMHDGLGGQLIHALALAEKGEQPGALTDALGLALQDLRLIIDSLAPDENVLDQLLASFRHRSTPMLEEAGIASDWLLDEDLSMQVTPHQALALLRFLQEGITNAMKHARCNRVRITVAALDERRLRASVEDDGIGIAPGVKQGRGLRNMQIRAREMGGELTIESTPGSTIVAALMVLEEVDTVVG